MQVTPIFFLSFVKIGSLINKNGLGLEVLRSPCKNGSENAVFIAPLPFSSSSKCATDITKITKRVEISVLLKRNHTPSTTIARLWYPNLCLQSRPTIFFTCTPSLWWRGKWSFSFSNIPIGDVRKPARKPHLPVAGKANNLSCHAGFAFSCGHYSTFHVTHLEYSRKKPHCLISLRRTISGWRLWRTSTF